jgi:membrane protease YdiL (CAAX protease family)
MKDPAMTATSSFYNGTTGGVTPGEPLGLRILRFPLTRILLAIVFFMVPFLLIQAGATHFFEVKLFSRLGQLFGACMGCLSYAFYVTKVEKRAVFELSFTGSPKEYGTGFVVGGLMICASVASIASMGGLRIVAFTPNVLIVLPLLMHLTVGIIEEMLMRGIIFRVLQDSLGTWIALATSSLVFGAMHLVNDNVTVLAIANITAAGVVLAVAYLLTGRLWLCAGMHAAMNFFQDGIFSIAVSGHAVKTGLLLTDRSGPDWLTGGAFGIEGSAVDLTLVVLAGVGMLVLAQRRGRIVRPFWKR